VQEFVLRDAKAYIEEHKTGKKLKNHEYAIVLKSLSEIDEE